MICRLSASGWYWMNMVLITLAMCTGLQVIMVACTTTAVVCLALHAWKSMSHLSWNDGMQQRLERRRWRRSSIRVQRQLMAVVLLCGVLNARAMEGEQAIQEAVLQRMASMAEAATRAAIAAEEALKRPTSSSSGATNPHEGLSAASRILKPPDTFNGEDIMLFQQWKHQFTSWLCFGDHRYAEALDLLEKKDTAPAWSTYNDDERSMSQKLYAVLASYLRGKCAHMVRAESKVKDGFKLWFNLNHEFMPSTRQRSLALAQALRSYPAFGRDRSSLESILNYEQLVLEYEQASGSVYAKELMAATLIKCCQPRLREQIQLSITDTTSYVDTRERDHLL